MGKSSFIKNSIIFVTILALVIALYISFSKINELNENLINLQNHFEQNINVIRSDMANIYENVDQKLQKEASILSRLNITYGNIDTNNNTAPLLISVTPKSSDKSTTVSVKIGNKTAELNREGEIFSGYIDTYLFIEDSAVPLITVKTNGTMQNEYLEGYDMQCLFTRYMPNLYANMVIREDSYSNKKTTINKEISVDFKPASDKDEVTFNQFFLIGENGGEEFYRKDITKDVENSSGKVFSIEKIYNSDEYKNYQDKKYYIQVIDSLGYTHKKLVTTIYHGGDNTSSTEIVEAVDSAGLIYGKNGNLLYGKE